MTAAHVVHAMHEIRVELMGGETVAASGGDRDDLSSRSACGPHESRRFGPRHPLAKPAERCGRDQSLLELAAKQPSGTRALGLHWAGRRRVHSDLPAAQLHPASTRVNVLIAPFVAA